MSEKRSRYLYYYLMHNHIITHPYLQLKRLFCNFDSILFHLIINSHGYCLLDSNHDLLSWIACVC